MKRCAFMRNFFIVFLWVCIIGKTWANITPLDTKEECQKLISEGKKAISDQHYPLSLELFTKAEFLAEKKQWYDELFVIKNNIGNIYSALTNYGDALDYYRQALELAKRLKSEENVSKVFNNIGLVYAYEKDYQNAIAYFKKAYIFKSAATRPRVAVNISDIYNTLGNFSQAKFYLEEVKNIPTTEETVQMWTINYAESLLLEGKAEEALNMAENLSKNIESSCYYCITELLSKIYLKLGKTDLAIQYAKQGLQNEQNFLKRSELYSQLFKLYEEKKAYKTAILYKDSVLIAKDSITARTNRSLYETIKVKLKIQEYQNELQANKERQETERKFFIVIIGFSIILCFSIYRGLRNKIIKQKQEKMLIERNQQITSLELQKQKKEHLLIEKQLENTKSKALLKQEQLKNKIAENNRKLSSKVLYISGRNKLIDEVINLLAKVPEVSKNREVSNYIKQLKDYLKTDNEWDEFVEHFEKVNPGLLKTLKKMHPRLTAKDIRFLCYVYMNLDTKELSTVFNITPDACRKRSKRLLEKMDLNDDDSLYEYLLKIN